jgi:hypothetical protein
MGQGWREGMYAWLGQYVDLPTKESGSIIDTLPVQAQDHDAGALYVPIRDTAKSSFESTTDLKKWFWLPFPEARSPHPHRISNMS